MPDPLLARVPPEAMGERLAKDRAIALRDRDDATFMDVAANAPELYDWYRDSFYATVFHGGRVDVRTKELLRYRLSMMHGCAFCNRGNALAARKAGVTAEQLRSVLDENDPVFDARDRAVLALADRMAMTNLTGVLDAPLYAALRAHFDDAQIFELGMTAGILTGMAKFLFAFDLVAKEANCPVPDRD